jgi:uncharacterized membrane protein YphA (DoxX/SURF4 family)
MGLLLLRATFGIAAVVQGGAYLFGRGHPTLGTWAAGLLTLACGASLLIGFLTQLAGLLMGLGSIALAFSSLPPTAQNPLDNGFSILFVVSLSAAIMLVGPGAYSLDARLFGRREIIIPQASGTSES